MMDSLLIALAALAPDPFFLRSYAVGSWTRWAVSGDVNVKLSRIRVFSETGVLWKIEVDGLLFEVLLSADRSDLISAALLDEQGKIEIIQGAGMWYIPLERVSAQKQADSILSVDEICETTMDTFSCAHAHFSDDEGNHFRWLLCEEVIGGVVQYEIVFKGNPDRVLRYTLIEQGR